MECVCPSASPSFPSMGWWINKNFPLAGSLSGMWHTVSRSPRFSRWLARSFTDKITSRTVRGGIQERGVISKIEAELHPHQFTNGNLCAFGQLAYMCVCVPWQGSCLIIRARVRTGWIGKRPASICQSFITELDTRSPQLTLSGAWQIDLQECFWQRSLCLLHARSWWRKQSFAVKMFP